jgi:cytochrome c peroxidase
VNVAHYRWWPWDGRSDSLWMQCAVAYEAAATMAGSRSRLTQRMALAYANELGALGVGLSPAQWADDPAAQGAAAIGYKALAAYLQRLNSANAPFDRFASGDETALSDDAKRGLKLFLGKAGCIECHNGPAFNGVATARNQDDFFRSVGIAQRGENVVTTDLGHWEGIGVLLEQTKGPGVYNSAGLWNDARDLAAMRQIPFNRVASVAQREVDKGRFRIKTLRQVAETAPYMHAGQLATLAEVVHFYNVGGDVDGYAGERDRLMQPLGLTPDEERQLVTFLESLTGAPLPSSLTCDRSAAPPRAAYPRCDGSTK